MEDFYKDDYNKVFWHSSAHILASALKEIYGNNIKLGIGPAIDNGFYYDIDFGTLTLDTTDLKKIEDKFIEIAKRNEDFIRKEVSKKDALQYFKKI